MNESKTSARQKERHDSIPSGSTLPDGEQILAGAEAFGGRQHNDLIGHTDDGHTNGDESLTRKAWLAHNAPLLETPDPLLDRIYYFRWNNLLSNLGKRRSDGKYEFTESAEGSWYHKYIDCAQGAHVRDARWIRDPRYLNDYIDVTPDAENYWGYLLDSVWQKYRLDGDLAVIERNYDKLKARFHSRDDKLDAEIGLYYLENSVEGQEAGINGFDRIERGMTYRASFTAAGSSLEALTDNRTVGAFWSTEGSPAASDTVEIVMGTDNTVFSGLRLWFGAGKQIPVIEVLTRGGEWAAVTDATVTEGPFGMTEIAFSRIEGDAVRLTFSSRPVPVVLYELVPVFSFEPWGCDSFWKLIGGDESYRICANSFMAAAAAALAHMATALGKTEEAKAYQKRSEELREAILRHLWDGREHFFFELTHEEKHRIVGKESNAYAPWAFSLVPDTEAYAEAWRYLMDENVFAAPFGITTLEKGSPHYLQPFGHGCLWNGPVWPYTFSLILTAMAEHLHSRAVKHVTKDDYYDLLTRYMRCHFDSDSTTALAIREDHHPTENRWIASCPDYNHSTFIDNVLNGLIGIRPAEDGLTVAPLVPDRWDYFCVEGVSWRGKRVTVRYDKNGDRYGCGKGFCVTVDGEVAFLSDKVEAVTVGKNEGSTVIV